MKVRTGRPPKKDEDRATIQQKLWLSPAQKAVWEAAQVEDRWTDDPASWIKRIVEVFIRDLEFKGYKPDREAIARRTQELVIEEREREKRKAKKKR